jgi:cytochrome P450
MKEAMRCHPGVSYPLERVVPEGGTVLCGTHLEAGTIVGVNAAVVHHDKSIFGEDAALFRPERWIDSDGEKIKLMDRHLMTVSANFLLLYQDFTNAAHYLVRLWISNMYWEEHFYYGNGETRSTSDSSF